MIVYIQKFFRFVHFCGSFPIKTNENVFLKNKHLHMHSSTQISHTDIIFDADSEFNVRFPELWLFTFSRNKLWIQPKYGFRHGCGKSVELIEERKSQNGKILVFNNRFNNNETFFQALPQTLLRLFF